MLKTYEQWKRGDNIDELPIVRRGRHPIEKRLENMPDLPECKILENTEFTKVNCFTENDWLKIKGIGTKLAKKLVENKPYASIEDISKVKGVGKLVLENIKNVVNLPLTVEVTNVIIGN